MGFEALAIETADNESPSDDNESPSEAEHAADVADVDAASTEEADPVFAFACLLADAVRTRQEVRKVWAEWAPAADHGATLLGAASEAAFAVVKLERIVNQHQLTLGLPDTDLSTLAAAAAPRVQLRQLKAKPELNGRCGTLGARDAQSGRYAVTIDGAAAGSPPVHAKAANLCGEHGWEARPEALLGTLQQVERCPTMPGPPSPSGDL